MGFKNYTIIFYENAGFESAIIVEGKLHYTAAKSMLPQFSKYNGLKIVNRLCMDIGPGVLAVDNFASVI